MPSFIRGARESVFRAGHAFGTSSIHYIRDNLTLLVGCLLGLIGGAALTAWRPSLLPYLVGVSFISWWYLVVSGTIHFSRRVALTSAFALIGVAILVIYWDRPPGSLAPDSEKVQFSFGVEDRTMLNGWSYYSPEIRLDQEPDGWWWGSVQFRGTLDDNSKPRPLTLRVVLPEDVQLVTPGDGELRLCVRRPNSEPVELICTMKPTNSYRTFDVETNFWWKPKLPRLRIGETYMRILRVPPDKELRFAKADANHAPPRVSVFTKPNQMSMGASNPEPDYSLLTGYAWRLDFPDGFEQEFLDIVLVDRRMRFIADQAPNLLALGGGLLLGLLAEPISKQQSGNQGTSQPTP